MVSSSQLLLHNCHLQLHGLGGGDLVVCEEKYYHSMKMAVAPKFYSPSGFMCGNVVCWFFLKLALS